jgi:hypothetical protein
MVVCDDTNHGTTFVVGKPAKRVKLSQMTYVPADEKIAPMVAENPQAPAGATRI